MLRRKSLGGIVDKKKKELLENRQKIIIEDTYISTFLYHVGHTVRAAFHGFARPTIKVVDGHPI